MNTNLLSILIRRSPTTGKRQLDSSLMGWMEMTFRQPPRFIDETSPYWITPSSAFDLRIQVLSWVRMLKARPTLPETEKSMYEEDEIDRIKLSPDWRKKLGQARAQFRWHNPSHPPELDKHWPSERAMKYRGWICQRAEIMWKNYSRPEPGPAENQQTPPETDASEPGHPKE